MLLKIHKETQAVPNSYIVTFRVIAGESDSTQACLIEETCSVESTTSNEHIFQGKYNSGKIW